MRFKIILCYPMDGKPERVTFHIDADNKEKAIKELKLPKGDEKFIESIEQEKE